MEQDFVHMRVTFDSIIQSDFIKVTFLDGNDQDPTI